MKQVEEITREQIADVRPGEVARWIGRFGVMKIALEATKGAWVEGGGESGYTAYSLGKAAKRGKDWRATKDYQQMLLLQLDKLQPGKNYVPDLRTEDQVSDHHSEQSIERAARTEVMQRIGIIEQQSRRLAPGALAVYAHWRADIHEPADRYLYEHMEEPTEASAHELNAAVGRTLSSRSMYQDYYELMFGGASETTTQQYEHVWQHLYEDLHTVDRAAESIKG